MSDAAIRLFVVVSLIILPILGGIWLIRIHRRRRAGRGGRTVLGWWVYHFKQQQIAGLVRLGKTQEQAEKEVTRQFAGAAYGSAMTVGIVVLLITLFTIPISTPFFAFVLYRAYRQFKLANKES